MLTAIGFLFVVQLQAEAASEHRLAGELLAEYSRRWAAEDAEGLAALWTPDGDVVTLAGGIFRGRPAIGAFFRESLSGAPKSQFQTVVDSARQISGEVILVDGQWRMIPRASTAKTITGIFTAVLIRGAEGWRFAALRSGIPSGGHTRGIGRGAFP